MELGAVYVAFIFSVTQGIIHDLNTTSRWELFLQNRRMLSDRIHRTRNSGGSTSAEICRCRSNMVVYTTVSRGRSIFER